MCSCSRETVRHTTIVRTVQQLFVQASPLRLTWLGLSSREADTPRRSHVLRDTGGMLHGSERRTVA